MIARRRRLGAALTLAVALAVAIAVVLETRSPSSRSSGSTVLAAGATSVQRRDLVETDTESGILSNSDPQTVYDRLSGTITWLPHVGQVIKPGETLFRVDGRPVTLMDGSTPAYRELSAADVDGNDITELNRNLVHLGFDADGVVIDDIWQPATTVGIEQLQEALGEPVTGSLPLGDVVFLPGERIISAVDGALGSTGAGAGSPAGSTSGASTASVAPAPPAPKFVSVQSLQTASGTTRAATTTNTTTATTTTSTSSTTRPHTPGDHGGRPHTPGDHGSVDQGTLSALAALLKATRAELRAQTAQLKADKASAKHSAGSKKGASSSRSSQSAKGGNAQAILETTSARQVVTVDLAASSQSEASVGEHVTVELPAGNTVAGTVTAVSPVALSSPASGAGSPSSGPGGGGSSSGSSSTVPVTITLKHHHTGAGLDQAAVSVNFARQRARHVLSVPVTALLATSGDSYAVQQAAAPHQLIGVTTGLFAAGYVQISGPGIHPGLEVTASQG